MKSKMEKLPHLADIGTNEQKLFHGTSDETTIRHICYQNFNPQMHGQRGTVYGQGVHFSSAAKYSHQSTQPCVEKNGRRFLFLARVLVGKSTLGKAEFQHATPLEPARPRGSMYDSCVDNTSDPTVFVIFDSDQCYPEFLIEYESREKERPRSTGAESGGVAHRSGAWSAAALRGLVAAAAASTPGRHAARSPVVTCQSTTPVSASLAVAAATCPVSPSVTATSSATETKTSPVTTPSGAVPPSPDTSMKGCIVM